jgi:hypothetical protein
MSEQVMTVTESLPAALAITDVVPEGLPRACWAWLGIGLLLQCWFLWLDVLGDLWWLSFYGGEFLFDIWLGDGVSDRGWVGGGVEGWEMFLRLLPGVV